MPSTNSTAHTAGPWHIVKRNGRSYFACSDCGRKFNSHRTLDSHKCKYRADAISDPMKREKNPLTNWGKSSDDYQLIDGLLCTGGGARCLGRLSGFREQADLDFVMQAINAAAKTGGAA